MLLLAYLCFALAAIVFVVGSAVALYLDTRYPYGIR